MSRDETANSFFDIVRDDNAKVVYQCAQDHVLSLLTRDILADVPDAESRVVARDSYLGQLAASCGITGDSIQQVRRECEDLVADQYGFNIQRIA